MQNGIQTRICVSGSDDPSYGGLEAYEAAKNLGKEIIKQGSVLVTGAATGFPFWASMGAKSEGGISIGLSPASSEKEHVNVYRLPIEYMDVVIYTGFGMSGRSMMLSRSADAVIFGCGKIETISEFDVAYRDGKPIGVLEGSWKTDETIKELTKVHPRGTGGVVFDGNAERLVRRLLELININKKRNFTQNQVVL